MFVKFNINMINVMLVFIIISTMSCNNKSYVAIGNKNDANFEIIKEVPYVVKNVKDVNFATEIRNGQLIICKDYFTSYMPTKEELRVFKKKLQKKKFVIYKEYGVTPPFKTINGVQWEVVENAVYWHNFVKELKEYFGEDIDFSLYNDAYKINYTFSDSKKTNLFLNFVFCLHGKNPEDICVIKVKELPYFSEEYLRRLYLKIKKQNKADAIR